MHILPQRATLRTTSFWIAEDPTLVPMPDIQSPPVRLRRLARELRALRDAAGLLPQDAAAALGWHPSKLSRLENARNYPNVEDVSAALDLYGVDSARRAALLELARTARKRGWWTVYGDVFTGSFMDMEDEACEIREWDQFLIPGLLQTIEYARIVIQAGLPGDNPEAVEQRVRARMARKTLLTRPNAPRLHALLDEAVFRRMPASPAVRNEQLTAILNSPANVTVQVLPLDCGVHMGMEGSFVVMSFPDEADPDQAYVGGPAGEIYVESAEQVARCNLVFRQMLDIALSPHESADWIRSLVQEEP